MTHVELDLIEIRQAITNIKLIENHKFTLQTLRYMYDADMITREEYAGGISGLLKESGFYNLAEHLDKKFG